ncbi:hypothetical protein [Halobacteriovorax sp. HLS]|uniref:hypothetical protein n=1 Tax=Halobacteriovorax sp. HLS TaxID=2234000 RepID=UPI000FD78A28|nr:hypothetical protein [Halobacteriovorax sp. HLS]
MKQIILLILISISNLSNASLGGVDVGNGRVVNIDIEQSFPSELQLIEYVNNIQRSISVGKNDQIIKLLKVENCKKSKIIDLKVKKKLPVSKRNTFKLNHYSGEISLKLSECENDKK